MKTYKKESDFSYSPGSFVTYELLRNKPEAVRRVYIHSQCEKGNRDGVEDICMKKNIPVANDDKAFKSISQKENVYIAGEFAKYSCSLSNDAPHIVLANPSDMGNLGAVIRSMAGFNIRDLAVITPAADIFNPKTVRSSMGSLFRIRFEFFGGYESYLDKFRLHKRYLFMSDGELELKQDLGKFVSDRFSLVFGNEACGLDESLRKTGTCVKIPQSAEIDSYNLSVAAGIAMFVFSEANGFMKNNPQI